MGLHDVLAGLGIAAGLIGIILVVTPGLLIILGAVLFWALIEGGTTAWVVAIVAVLVTGATTYLKYQRPGRRLTEFGVPTSHLVWASVVGLIGLFVIPVVGAPLGFVLTIYLLTRVRVGRERAWPSTKAALRAIAHSVGIELAGGVLIALVWLVAVIT